MSELNLNPALLPERPASVLTGLPGLPGTPRPGPGFPVTGAPPATPFADLIAGFLQGTQPTAPAVLAPLTEFSLADAPPASGVGPCDPLALLALPGSTTPPPAVAVTLTVAGSAAGSTTGNALPSAGQSLPVAERETTPVAGRPATPGTTLATTPGTTLAPEASPRISLADLALTRLVDPAPVPAPAVPPIAAAGGRLATLKGTGPEKSAGPSPGLPVTLLPAVGTPGQAPGLDNAPALRLSAADLLRNALPPGVGIELPGTSLGPHIAAFASGGDSATGLAVTSTVTGSGGPDAGSTALLGRLGTTTLPPLQPLGNHASFAGGLADRLLNLGGVGSHTARLQLHPESLGKLDVEIQIEDGSAQVWFGTSTSQAREAIEASLPRLKELFADQGIALTRTQVDSGGGQMGNPGAFQQRQAPGSNPFAPELTGWAAARGEPSSPASPMAARGPSTRLVDVWA